VAAAHSSKDLAVSVFPRVRLDETDAYPGQSRRKACRRGDLKAVLQYRLAALQVAGLNQHGAVQAPAGRPATVHRPRAG
jgi:hypothetical protein